jgi:hypothetical protein
MSAARRLDERSGEADPYLAFLEGVLMIGGGVPILAGGLTRRRHRDCGLAGQHDEECADAGVAFIAAKLK